MWKNHEESKVLLKEKSKLESAVEPFIELLQRQDDIATLIELSEEEGGEALIGDIQANILALRSAVIDLEFKSMMTEDHDKSNAIMTIHPGAGGTESQDWTQMLMRMYMRWAERSGFDCQIVDLLMGDVAGVKSVTLTVSGDYSYGFLKAEAGIHRLVRISPFDGNSRRHTSFAAALVYPEIEEDLDVGIVADDLRIDTFRASGAGGQHVNKTSSAVRITHIPTNIVVSCQNERSQFKNKATAMKILKARLYDLRKQEHDERLDEIKGEKKDIGWGNQIRSYILQPYQLVKDHRTGLEIGNVDAVLDGAIDEFIKGYLLSKRENQKK